MQGILEPKNQNGFFGLLAVSMIVTIMSVSILHFKVFQITIFVPEKLTITFGEFMISNKIKLV